MKNKKALIGSTVLSGVSLAATVTARVLNSKKEAERWEMREDTMIGIAFEVEELREALLRSYATGIKLREEHKQMRESIIAFAGENAKVLEGINATPPEDLFVETIAKRTQLFEEVTVTDEDLPNDAIE